jgi:hypothetical protein
MNITIDNFLELFKKDFSKFIILLLIVVIGFVTYPLYDLNFGYLNRLEQRASVLKILYEIKAPSVDNNLVLQKEYDEIVNELSACNPTIESTFKQYFALSKNSPTRIEEIWKTIAGGIVWLFFIVLFISINEFKFKSIKQKEGQNRFYHTILNKIKGITTTQKTFIVFLILGCIIGYIIPLFNFSSINYILLPAFELLFFLIINKIYQTANDLTNQ